MDTEKETEIKRKTDWENEAREKKRYFRLWLTGAAIAAAGLICFFIIYRAGSILAGVREIIQILTPFAYGAVIAYALAPACNRLEGLLNKVFHGKKTGLVAGLSILISYAAAIALIWVLLMLLLPQLWESILGIANAIPGELAQANQRLHDALAHRPEWQARWDEISSNTAKAITDWIRNDLLSNMGAMVGMVGSQVTGILGVLKNLFLGILISIYILISRKRFGAQAQLFLYGTLNQRWARAVEQEVHYADRMFNGFLRGKLIDSAIIGVLCFLGTTVMGIQSALLVSVIVGLTNIIPFFGPFIGAIPSALLILLENPMHCLYFVIFVVILQQLDGNVIGPKILGDSTGLSSFWVMFAILLFGGLWGVVGMIVGVPLCAVLYDVVRKGVAYGLGRHGQGGRLTAYEQEFHPAPEEISQKPQTPQKTQKTQKSPRPWKKRRKS